MTTRMLLLDAGNTRLKWAILDTPLTPDPLTPDIVDPGTTEPLPWLAQGAVDYHALSALPARWQQWGTLTACYGVNVAGDAADVSLQHTLAEMGLAPRWLKATAFAGGVKNTYQPPASLGADRWAALLAVRQRTPDAALVVSAGSALTVDALNAEGEFLGGIIVPGLAMMRQALAQSTAQVGTQYGKVLEFPNTTAHAVESGLVTACVGAIITMRSRLEQRCGTPGRIFLTGGDAATLALFLPRDVSMLPGLVLEGVYYMTVEERLP